MQILKKILYPFKTIISNLELIVEMSKKQIVDQYKGQPLGIFWAFFHPLVMILIYVFLFGVVYKTRIDTEEQSTLTYAAYLLSGMIPWLCIQMSLSSGSVSITTNPTLVKQVVFPIEVLPSKVVGASLIIEIIYIIMDVLYCLVVSQKILWTYFLVPFAIVIELMLLIGLNYMAASFTVYFRDIKDIVQVLCTIGIYILPVLYLPSAVPEFFKPILYINPLSHYIWIFQDILFWGEIRHWYSWIVSIIFSYLVLYVGDRVIKKLKVGFGSVL